MSTFSGAALTRSEHHGDFKQERGACAFSTTATAMPDQRGMTPMLPCTLCMHVSALQFVY
eukprot:6488171-Amphidinium_carterae.1